MKTKGREGQTWATVGLGDEVIFVVVRSTVARKGGWEHQGLVLQGGSIRLGKTGESLEAGKLHAFGEADAGQWDHTGSLKRIA